MLSQAGSQSRAVLGNALQGLGALLLLGACHSTQALARPPKGVPGHALIDVRALCQGVQGRELLVVLVQAAARAVWYNQRFEHHAGVALLFDNWNTFGSQALKA